MRAPLVRAAAAAAISNLLAGGAIETCGTLASRVAHAEAAVVVDRDALRAHLRPRADGRGLTIGVARRSYVFAADSAWHLAPGWFRLRARSPTVAAAAQHVASLNV
jgi:hypothetical protein